MAGGRVGHNKEGSTWARAERIYRPLSEVSRIKRCVQSDRQLLISHKPDFQGDTIQEWADGRGDAKMEIVLNTLRSAIPSDVEFYLGLFHEPEDDVAAKRFTADQFKAAFRRFTNRVTRKMPNARSTLVMMREIYSEPEGMYSNPRPRVKDHPLDPGEDVVDVYAGDPYNPWDLDPNYKWRELEWLTLPMVGYAEARGREAAVWETGCQNDPRKPQWILNSGTFARDAGLIHLSYFHGTGRRGTWDIEDGEGCTEAVERVAARKYFNRS